MKYERISHEPDWTPPQILRLDDASGLDALHENGGIRQFIDPSESIKREMNKEHLLRSNESIDDRLRVVYFPWSGQAVIYPDNDTLFQLRTSRNRPIISETERERLRSAKTAHYGLSVGSKITDQLLESSVGQTVLYGDPDVLDATNLNRIRSDVSHLGESKVSIAAKKHSIVNPYASQIHEYGGYRGEDSNRTLDIMQPDVIIDEMDQLAAKALLRRYAQTRGVPLVQVTDLGESSIVDVERYDINERQRPFNGRLPLGLVDELCDGRVLTEKETGKYLTQLAGGPSKMPIRIVRSGEKNLRGELSGIAQLGNTATAGACLADTVIREILVGRRVDAGSYYENPRRPLHLGRPDSIGEAVRAYRDYIAAARAAVRSDRTRP